MIPPLVLSVLLLGAGDEQEKNGLGVVVGEETAPRGARLVN